MLSTTTHNSQCNALHLSIVSMIFVLIVFFWALNWIEFQFRLQWNNPSLSRCLIPFNNTIVQQVKLRRKRSHTCEHLSVCPHTLNNFKYVVLSIRLMEMYAKHIAKMEKSNSTPKLDVKRNVSFFLRLNAGCKPSKFSAKKSSALKQTNKQTAP